MPYIRTKVDLAKRDFQLCVHQHFVLGIFTCTKNKVYSLRFNCIVFLNFRNDLLMWPNILFV